MNETTHKFIPVAHAKQKAAQALTPAEREFWLDKAYLDDLQAQETR